MFTLAGQNAWAGNDFSVAHDSHLTVKVATGQGKVYAKENKKGEESAPSLSNCHYIEMTAGLTNTKSSNNRPANFYILAMPDDGYEFDYWECTKNEGDDDTDKAHAEGTILTIDDSEGQTGNTWKVKAALSKRPNATSSSSGDESTVINAVWEAHFKEIITKYVDVESENTSLGIASIDKGNNNIGDEVTITASCNSTNVMFKGWYRIDESTGEKIFVTRNNPYTFTISENPDNTGTYYARFEDGYYFWRLKNHDTQHYVTSRAHYTGQVIPSNLKPALETQLGLQNDLASSITDAGTMMNIYLAAHQASTYAEIWDIFVQNESTRQYYEEAPGSGAYLAVSHQADNTYLIQSSKFYVIESNGELSASMDLNNIRPYGKWQLEGMDKDLTTKENYFAVDPNEFVGPDANGYYWTTLRVCFNMMYETSEITPFIVTAADADNGTLEIEEVTGGIIPAKTCVLLRCNSTDVLRNVMIPTRNSSSFNTNGNLLTSSQYYYKNQTVEGSLNLKGIKIIDGQLGFGGNTLTSVDGNRAYLSVANDVALEKETPEVTLAELLASGDTQNTYIVTDLTAVRLVDNDQLLFAKDNNGYPEDNKDENTGSDADYMQYASGLQHPMGLRAYDQSNWIALRVPTGDNISASVLGKHLTGVKGRLLSTVNPEFQLDVAPGSDDATAANVTPNTFVAASFQGSQDGFFFVQPKPMEIAYVEWAQWNGTKFIAPVHDENHPDWNQAELTGEFELNGAYLESQNENGGSLDMSTLVSGHVYAMEPAVIKVKTGDYNHVYVLGNVNGTAWSTNNGVEMNTNDGTTYTAIVTVNKADANNNNGYFSFTKKLGATWEAIKDYRIGAIADGNNYTITSTLLGQELPLIGTYGSGTKSFEIANGRYLLTLNLSTMKLVVTSVPAQAPRREAASKQYVVYPLSMTKVTSDDNGVVTGVTTVGSDRVAVGTQYINVAGVRASQPWNGVNIVITTYNDGTTTATKIVK